MLLLGRVFVSIFLLGGMMLTSMQCTTANYDDLQLTTGVDDFDPVDDVSTFETDQETIYLTGTLRNAPADTEIRAAWYYMEDGEEFLDEATLETGSTDFYFSLPKPADGWETGDYEVRLYIYDDKEETLTFRIE